MTYNFVNIEYQYSQDLQTLEVLFLDFTEGQEKVMSCAFPGDKIEIREALELLKREML